jgi:hypothetical protein
MHSATLAYSPRCVPGCPEIRFAIVAAAYGRGRSWLPEIHATGRGHSPLLQANKKAAKYYFCGLFLFRNKSSRKDQQVGGSLGSATVVLQL